MNVRELKQNKDLEIIKEAIQWARNRAKEINKNILRNFDGEDVNNEPCLNYQKDHSED